MRHARRLIAILIACATWCIASTTVVYASMLHDPVPAAPTALTSPASRGTPLWQTLAFVALGLLLAVAIVGLGNSVTHSRRSEPPRRSQQPLPPGRPLPSVGSSVKRH
jgi:hypothetical protein